MRKHALPILIVLILSYLTIQPLITSGFYPMHDDTQVARVVTMGKALRNNQFPVRWVSDLGYGYGYPIFNFYGPLPYYIGGFLYSFGVTGLVATKIMIALSLVLSGITMYFFASRIFGRLPAMLSSVLYMYAPYRAVGIYVRGSISEAWVFVFLPILFLGLSEIHRNKKPGVLLVGLGVAGSVLSHTVIGYVVTCMLVIGIFGAKIYSLIQKKTDFQVFSYIKGLFIGLGLSAFFWLPALMEMKYTSVSGQIGTTADFHDHFICPVQLWSSQWGYAGSAPGCADGMSFMLGKIHILLSLLSIGMFLFHALQKRKNDDITGFLKAVFYGALVITLISIIMMFSISVVVWELIPGFAYIQYPWRFLIFSTTGLSVLGGSIVNRFQSAYFRVLTLIAGLSVVLVFNAKWFQPQYTYQRPALDFETKEEIRWHKSKISDEYLPASIQRPDSLEKVVYTSYVAPISFQVGKTMETETYVRLDIDNKSKGTLLIQRADFPGTKYFVNGEQIDPEIVSGLPRMVLSSGKHVVEVIFTNTPIRVISNIISLAVLIFLLVYYGRKKTVT